MSKMKTNAISDSSNKGRSARSSIALVGLPGVGKSTIGRQLAHELDRGFVDTDELIVARQRQALQDIVDQSGYMALREIEQTLLLDLDINNAIIATGGSVVYSSTGMQKLSSIATIAYLSCSYELLQERLLITDSNVHERGLAKPAGQTLRQLYDERMPLYESVAEMTIEVDGLSIGKIVKELRENLER